MSRHPPAGHARDDDRPVGLGWLSVGAAVLFTVLLAVHLANKPGLWPPAGTPAKAHAGTPAKAHAGAPAKSIAQPSATSERSPS